MLEQEIEFEEAPLFDPIHGFVNITTAEKEIINSIFFQRLREVKQLGMAHFVFLGAVHNRTSHSVGVLATVSKILHSLRRNDFDIKSTSNVSIINSRDELKLRMAALLHDIGHYPYSHLVESVYKDIAGEKEAHHESLGAYIILNTNEYVDDFQNGITKILAKYFTYEEIDDIALMIQGKSKTNWYNQIMHSELDADRMDYLLRDSHNTGFEYGSFDLDYLINNLKLVFDYDTDELVLAVKSNALFTVEHFLLSRYFWYAQIICHRSISVFDGMGKTVFKWLVENGYAYTFDEIIKQIKTKPYKFFQFNDQYFWERIYWLADPHNNTVKVHKDYMIYQKLSQMLIQRKPLAKVQSRLRKKLVFKKVTCSKFELSCPTGGFCQNSEGCPQRDKSTDTIRVRYEQIKDSIDNSLHQNGQSTLWSISSCKKVYISKLRNERKLDELKRDSIRIIDKVTGKVRHLDENRHSLINQLNKYELNISRTYVLEELHHLLEGVRKPD